MHLTETISYPLFKWLLKQKIEFMMFFFKSGCIEQKSIERLSRNISEDIIFVNTK